MEEGGCLKATVENPRGSVGKLSLKESVGGAHTVLRGQGEPSLRAPEGLSEGRTEEAKPTRFFSREFSLENPEGAPKGLS